MTTNKRDGKIESLMGHCTGAVTTGLTILETERRSQRLCAVRFDEPATTQKCHQNLHLVRNGLCT